MKSRARARLFLLVCFTIALFALQLPARRVLERLLRERGLDRIQTGAIDAGQRIVRVPLFTLVGGIVAAPGNYLVHDERGHRFTLSAIRKRFDALDVDWQIRDLRAKAASDSTTSLAAQRLLGHAAATTTDRYIRHGVGERVTPIMRK